MAEYQHLLRPRTNTVVLDASFARRMIAFIVDLLLLDIVVTAPFTSVLSGLAQRAEAKGFVGVTYTRTELGAIIVIFLVIYLYFVLFEYLLGQSIGMMLLHIRVVPGKLWQHLVRNSFLLPIFPFVLFWVIEPIAILFWRRGALEYITSTRTTYQRSILI